MEVHQDVVEQVHGLVDQVQGLEVEHLQENIIDVRDAKKADLERLFGAAPGAEGDLGRLVVAAAAEGPQPAADRQHRG